MVKERARNNTSILQRIFSPSLPVPRQRLLRCINYPHSDRHQSQQLKIDALFLRLCSSLRLLLTLIFLCPFLIHLNNVGHSAKQLVALQNHVGWHIQGYCEGGSEALQNIGRWRLAELASL